MNRMRRFILVSSLPALLLCAAGASKAADKAGDKQEAIDRLQKAGVALENLSNAPDQGIPDSVFRGAKCIAVVPNLTKGGFIFGAERGRGVATCRLAGDNDHWSAPEFFTLTGGSWGAQIGVEDVHLVIMVMNDEGMRHLLSNKFQIGGDASASAGPVGREAAAGTDWKADTQMLTYARSKGLFAGIDLAGAWVQPDKDLTVAYYGHDMTPTQVLAGGERPPESAHAFLDEVSRVKQESAAQ